jgi:ABC-type nitrate/sulfonate/bicarbonate transport system permease component
VAGAVPSAPPWWKRLRAEPDVAVRLALGAVGLLVVLGIWWFVTHGEVEDRIISPNKLPSPGEVFSSFGRLLDRHLGDSIVATLQRVFIGVGLAAVVGVVLGVAAGANRGVAAALGPVVIFLRSVPMGALLPLTLLLFSTGEKQKTMFLFLAIVPFVFSDSVKAVSLVPERYVETAQTLGASNRQIISKVLVPLALPDIITSIRFQVGLALGYVTLAEVIDTPTGLGALINASQREGPYEHVYLLLFVIAVIAFAIDLLLRTLQRGVFAWRRDL